MSRRIRVYIFILFFTIILASGCITPPGSHTTKPPDTSDGFPAPAPGLDQSVPVTSIVPPQTTVAIQGRPCQTNEEWHNKADQVGAWKDGFLISQDTTDDEIRSIVNNYTRVVSPDIRISIPHYIGYYATMPEPEYQSFRQMIDDNVSEWNMSFSSPMFGFIEPEVKAREDDIVAPVFISYSDRMKEPDVFDNLVHRNVSLTRTKVVRFDLSPNYSPVEREMVLRQLNADKKVIFVFKEYLEGVLC